MATSKNKWVELNASLRDELLGLMGKVQQDPHFHVPVLDVDITLSNTGISQYLRAPLLNWSKMTHPKTNLQLLLKPDVDQTFLADEKDARCAAYLIWSGGATC